MLPSRISSTASRAVAILAIGLLACQDEPDNGVFITPDADAGVDASDTSDATDPDSVAEPDADVVDTDAGDDVEEDVVEPPPYDAVRIAVSVRPAFAVYPLEYVVTPVAVAFDAEGQTIEDATFTWTVTPDGAASESGTGYSLDIEGRITFTACDAFAVDVCGSVSVNVDGGSPELIILRPQPGEELLASESPTIVVEGIATDTNVTPNVFINGQRMTLDEEGRFITEVTPRFGINHIEAIATDNRNVVETQYGLDVMWAEIYSPFSLRVAPEPVPGEDTGEGSGSEGSGSEGSGSEGSGSEGSGSEGSGSEGSGSEGSGSEGSGLGEGSGDVEYAGTSVYVLDAAMVRLGQNFADDGRPLRAPDETGTVRADDLADLFQLLLSNIDLLSALPNPVIDSETVSLSVLGLDLSSARVFVDVSDTGLDLFLDFPDVVLETSGFVSFGGQTIDLTGTLGLSFAALIELDISKPTREDPLTVEVAELNVAVEEIRPDFASAEANAIFEFADNVLSSTFENLVVNQLGGALFDQIPALVESALVAIEDLLGSGTPFALDTGILPTVNLILEGQIATVEAQRRTHLTLGLDLGVSTDSGPLYPDSRGVAVNFPEDSAARFFETARVQVAARQSFLNGLLYSLWNAGLLRGDISSVLPTQVAFLIDYAEINSLLPPVVTSSRPDESTLPLLISIGQFEVVLGKGAQRDRIGVTLRIGADIALDGSTISVRIDDVPNVQIWLIDSNAAEPIFPDPAELRNLILTGIWPLVGESLAGGISFELPAIGGDVFAGIAPNLGALTLQLELDRPVLLRDGHVFIEAGLTGILPANEGSGSEGSGSEGSGSEGSGSEGSGSEGSGSEGSADAP